MQAFIPQLSKYWVFCLFKHSQVENALFARFGRIKEMCERRINPMNDFYQVNAFDFNFFASFEFNTI